MAKNNTRQGSGALPQGQTQRGYPNQNQPNNKNDFWDGMGIPDHNDPAGQAKRGYPSTENRNTSKGQVQTAVADGYLTNYPSYNQPAAPSTTVVSANRSRQIGAPK